MIAYVTSIGEPTTNLCTWSLERNGFTVFLVQDSQPLGYKLKFIYESAKEDFIRVDADVVVNGNCTEDHVRAAIHDHQWWACFRTFDWFKQDLTTGGVQYIKKEALPTLKQNIDHHLLDERPESSMYRLPEFHNPRRCDWHPAVMGIHGYGIRDYNYVKATKARRSQKNYDWELVKKLNAL